MIIVLNIVRGRQTREIMAVHLQRKANLPHIIQARDPHGLRFGFGESGKQHAARIAIMAITSSSSMSVKPGRL